MKNKEKGRENNSKNWWGIITNSKSQNCIDFDANLKWIQQLNQNNNNPNN